MDLEPRFTEGTNIEVTYYAAMEIMALSDTEQEQFFNKVVKINFDDTFRKIKQINEIIISFFILFIL